MKNQKTYLALIAIFTVVYLASCKHSTAEIEIENKITFDTLSLSDNYHVNNDSTMPSCNLKLTFIYPIGYDNNMPILDSLHNIFISNFLNPSFAMFRSAPMQALEKYKEAYIDNYLHDINLFYNNKSSSSHEENDKYLSYYETITNEIIFNKQNILSFQIAQTNYKGGTSSYLLLKNYAIDLTTGQVIFEKDIFKSGYEEVLSNIFKEYLLRVNNVKNISDLQDMGYFGIDEITPNENLLIDDKGITYIFNKNEISTFKLDPVKITIPYEEIDFILKENSPISQFLAN